MVQKHLDLLIENKERLRETQQQKLESFEIQEAFEQSEISEYIDKNRELLLENDRLYKKVQELQEERDQLVQKSQAIIDSVNVIEHNAVIFEMLKWLYEYMGDHMEFKNTPLPNDLEAIKQIKEMIEIEQKSIPKQKARGHTMADMDFDNWCS